MPFSKICFVLKAYVMTGVVDETLYVFHEASSTGRLFHLIRYSLITRDHNFFSLMEMIPSGSRMTLPSSSKVGSVVCADCCLPSAFLRQGTWKTL